MAALCTAVKASADVRSEYIRRLVDAAPPLSDSQRAELRRLLQVSRIGKDLALGSKRRAS